MPKKTGRKLKIESSLYCYNQFEIYNILRDTFDTFQEQKHIGRSFSSRGKKNSGEKKKVILKYKKRNRLRS